MPPDIVWMHREEALEAYRWDGRALAKFRSVGADAGMPLMIDTPRELGSDRVIKCVAAIAMYGIEDKVPTQGDTRCTPRVYP